MANNFTVDYNDQRFNQVNSEKQVALDNVNNTYNNMINASEKYYDDLIQQSKDYANTQADIQNQQTQLAVDEINESKNRTERDYIREQKGAYADYLKETNTYGVGAEQLAQNGLQFSGYSETSRANLFNTYQNRHALARQSYNDAIKDYDFKIAEARLANSSALATIYADALKAQLELSLDGFQYKNTLLQAQMDKQNEAEDRYYSRWTDVLNQINTENKMAEEQRQYNEKMAYQRERDKIADEQWQKEYELSKQQLEISKQKASSSSSSSGYSYGGSSNSSNPTYSNSNLVGTKASNGQTIKANPYTGDVNPDAKNGVFSNGYQPNNVGGSPLSSSGYTVGAIFVNPVGKGGASLANQTIWKSEAGGYYVWDGSINDYVDVTSTYNKAVRKNGLTTYRWNY